MSTEDFDPTDLVLLAAGWTQGAERADGLSIETADALADAARMLARLYREVADEWDSVWGYEVAEPLGEWIGRRYSVHMRQPSPAAIETKAREIVAAAMNS